MAFSVRNPAVERKARAFAAQNGMTLTGALDVALDAAISAHKRQRDENFETYIARIREIQDRVAKLPDTGLTEDEIMGWDENGLPT